MKRYITLCFKYYLSEILPVILVYIYMSSSISINQEIYYNCLRILTNLIKLYLLHELVFTPYNFDVIVILCY